MKIATWNVNSIRVREPLVVDWLRTERPEVLCLQETKVVDDDFPSDELQRLGYAVAMSGQKTYNGVAIVSRLPMEDIAVGLEADPAPDDRRAIAATIDGVRVVCVYVPNGKSVESPSFDLKLRWLGALRETIQPRVASGEDLVVCGDFNIAPDERDVHDPEQMRGQLHFHPDEHRALEQLCALGLRDAFRIHRQEGELYSWWDYRGAAFRRNHGLRIDYLLVTDGMAGRCKEVVMDVEPRRAPKPSDHIPVVAEFA